MKTQEININVENGIKELVIRHGEALKINYPVTYGFEGILSAPGDFIEQRRQFMGLINTETAVVEVNRDALSITYKGNPTNIEAETITGKLEFDPIYHKFNVNNGSMRRLEFINKLKKLKFFFDDKEQFRKLIDQLQTFKAKSNIDLEQSKDNRGNRGVNFQKNVESELEQTIMVNLPIYKGYPPVKLALDICLDLSEGESVFWFESMDLYEIIDTLTDNLMKEQIERFDGFAILNV